MRAMMDSYRINYGRIVGYVVCYIWNPFEKWEMR